jgi:tetratricopeptide (TPR) repeat protein
MKRKASLHLFVSAILSSALIASVAVAQTEQTEQIDPLTGKPIPAPEEPEGPPRADLTEVNELVRAQDYAGAESLLATLQGEFPDDPDLLMLRGELLLALRRPEESIEVLRKVAQLTPKRPRLQFQLGSALAATGQAEAALEAFGKETETSDDPQVLVFSHINRSMLFQERQDWAASATELEAVLVLEPQRTPVYGDLVAMYVQSDRLDAAVDALNRGDDAGFRSAGHWYSVAARLAKDEEYERCVRLFEKAIEIDPEHADAERSLAAALEQLGREDEAIPHLRRYLELKPDAQDAAAIKAKIEAAGTS